MLLIVSVQTGPIHCWYSHLKQPSNANKSLFCLCLMHCTAVVGIYSIKHIPIACHVIFTFSHSMYVDVNCSTSILNYDHGHMTHESLYPIGWADFSLRKKKKNKMNWSCKYNVISSKGIQNEVMLKIMRKKIVVRRLVCEM